MKTTPGCMEMLLNTSHTQEDTKAGDDFHVFHALSTSLEFLSFSAREFNFLVIMILDRPRVEVRYH